MERPATESRATDGPATDSDVEALATRLAELDEELGDTERRLLRAMLVSAMDPLDRRRHLGSGFDDDQRSVLDRLEADRGGPPSLTAPREEGA